MSGTQRLLIGSLLLLASGVAAAEQNDAKARYLSGQSHYNLNEFAEALQDFKEAYRLRPDPAFLFNIAQCERQLGDLDEAIKFYRTYLRNKPDAANKREVERKIDELRGLVEAKKKATTGAPQSVIPPTSVEDSGGHGTAPPRATEPDRPAAHEPPATPGPVTPGPHEPPAAGSGEGAGHAGAASVPAAVEASPAAAGAGAPGADLTVHATEGGSDASQPIYRKWWFWAGAGAVVVGLGVVAAIALSGGAASPPGSALGNQKVF